MVTRRPHRTPVQTLEHLLERRRLAVAACDLSATRVEALDRAIARLRGGEKIEACDGELEPIPGIDDLDEAAS